MAAFLDQLTRQMRQLKNRDVRNRTSRFAKATEDRSDYSSSKAPTGRPIPFRGSGFLLRRDWRLDGRLSSAEPSLEFLADLERDGLTGRNLDYSTSLRVASLAGRSITRRKHSEVAQLDPVAIRKGDGDGVKEHLDNVQNIGLGRAWIFRGH
jgi:hypothetical protein